MKRLLRMVRRAAARALEVPAPREDAVVHGALRHSLDEIERTGFGPVRR
ncbi:hypothetical protein ABGB18_00330 [Nonomuraea sp. B12E4]